MDRVRGHDVDCLASSRSRLGLAGPPVAERERDGHDLLPNQFEAAWEAFQEAVEPDVGEAVVALVTEPGRWPTRSPRAARRSSTATCATSSSASPPTAGSCCSTGGWPRAGNPAEDLAWYLMHCAWRIRATRDELVEDFRALRDDPVALDLGLLGGLVMYGWILGHSAVVHPDPAERAWAREELGVVGAAGPRGPRAPLVGGVVLDQRRADSPTASSTGPRTSSRSCDRAAARVSSAW